MAQGLFTISPAVRARRESFGLLFYDTRNAKLTFVHSQTLLEIDTSCGLKIEAHSDAEQAHAQKILVALQKKGLVTERPSEIQQ